jgi:hypothetical protein
MRGRWSRRSIGKLARCCQPSTVDWKALKVAQDPLPPEKLITNVTTHVAVGPDGSAPLMKRMALVTCKSGWPALSNSSDWGLASAPPTNSRKPAYAVRCVRASEPRGTGPVNTANMAVSIIGLSHRTRAEGAGAPIAMVAPKPHLPLRWRTLFDYHTNSTTDKLLLFLRACRNWQPWRRELQVARPAPMADRSQGSTQERRVWPPRHMSREHCRRRWEPVELQKDVYG